MRKLLALLVSALLAVSPVYAANNAVVLTPGSGVTLRSIDIGAGVQSLMQILGDSTGTAIYGTAGTANANVLSVQGIASGTSLAVTATQSGTWNITNISGTISLPTGAATSALQGTNTATTTHTCSTGGYSEIGCLGQIDDDVKNPLPSCGANPCTNRIGMVDIGVNVTPTDCSSTITAGGTAQNAFTAQTTLHGFTIANIDSTSGSGEPLWISFTTTAAASTAASYPIPAPTATTFASFGSFTAPPGFGLNHALSVIAATTGHKFSCTWW